MDKINAQKKEGLKQEALKWEALFRIANSSDYKNYLKPILESAFQNLWPDPAESKTPEEFHKQYSEQWGRAMAYKDLYNLLESSGKVAQNIAEQIKNPDKDYGIS